MVVGIVRKRGNGGLYTRLGICNREEYEARCRVKRGSTINHKTAHQLLLKEIGEE